MEQVDRQLREFIGKLEALAVRDEWSALVAAIERQPDPRFQKHPVVRALLGVAQSALGKRSHALEMELARLDEQLAGESSDYAPLVDAVRIARVQQILLRAGTAGVLEMNVDLFHTLLGTVAETPNEVRVRQRLAGQFETNADKLMEEAAGLIRSDAVLVREARVGYQNALRWIVLSSEWERLTPITPGAAADIERLIEKLRQANRVLHGPQLPFTSNDSSTWTGKQGDPIHTIPDP
jgi:hypothetical protein